jgi:hypothetical protein
MFYRLEQAYRLDLAMANGTPIFMLLTLLKSELHSWKEKWGSKL